VAKVSRLAAVNKNRVNVHKYAHDVKRAVRPAPWGTRPAPGQKNFVVPMNATDPMPIQ
jgi:hypothetical protein